MEEILASIRRIISEDNDDAAKTVAPNGAANADQAAPAPADDFAANSGMSSPANQQHAPAQQHSAEVLELTQVVPEEAPAPASTPLHEVPQAQETQGFQAQAPEMPAQMPPQEEPSMPDPSSYAPAVQEAPRDTDLMVVDRENDGGALVSTGVENQAAAAFQTLHREVVVTSNDGQTLEGMVQDMMRPMLKEWLEDNLGNIVEDVVTREVNRIASRGR